MANKRKKRGAQTKLNSRQQLAANAYLVNGGNKKEACLTAGYSKKTAQVQTQAVFDHPLVVAEIKRRTKRAMAKNELDHEWVIRRLMARAQSGETLAKFKVVQEDGTLMWDFEGATENELALVGSLAVDFYTEGKGPNAETVKKFRITEPDAQAALIALARHLGLFNDSIEVKGSLAERIQAGRDRALGNAKEEDE